MFDKSIFLTINFHVNPFLESVYRHFCDQRGNCFQVDTTDSNYKLTVYITFLLYCIKRMQNHISGMIRYVVICREEM